MPKALPENDQAEAFVLGSVLLNQDLFVQVCGMLSAGDFAREAHRRIFSRMKDLYDRGEKIDRVTLANELLKQGQIESVGGFEYLVSLDEGLPQSINLDSYIRIVKDNRDLRALAFLSQYLEEQVKSRISPLDIATDVHSRLVEIERGAMVLDSVPKMDAIVDGLGGPYEILHPPSTAAAIPTGFRQLDILTTGLEPGTLTVIAGRVSSGKTSLGMCIAQNVAESQTPVAMFSLEMSKKALLDRMICVTSKMDFGKYRSRKLNPQQEVACRNAIEHLYDLPIYIEDKGFNSMGDIGRKIDRLASKHGVRVFLLDYCQMLTARLRGKSDRRNTTEILGDAVEEFKVIAKRLNVAFVLLSQLSRDPDKRSGDHRPMLTDLKDSSSLEQAADLVIMTYREWSFKPDQEHLRDYCELIVNKSRNGATGKVGMRFFGGLGGRFEEI